MKRWKPRVGELVACKYRTNLDSIGITTGHIKTQHRLHGLLSFTIEWHDKDNCETLCDEANIYRLKKLLDDYMDGVDVLSESYIKCE